MALWERTTSGTLWNSPLHTDSNYTETLHDAFKTTKRLLQVFPSCNSTWRYNDRNVWHSTLTALGTMLIKDAAHRPNVGAECIGPWKTVSQFKYSMTVRPCSYPIQQSCLRYTTFRCLKLHTQQTIRRKYFQRMCTASVWEFGPCTAQSFSEQTASRWEGYGRLWKRAFHLPFIQRGLILGKGMNSFERFRSYDYL